MTPTFGELCAVVDCTEELRAALTQSAPQGPTDRIASIAKAVQECAYAWGPNARLLGNVCAEDIADLCSAVLAHYGTPANNTREGN